MTSRCRVYVQVKNQVSNRWHNEVSAPTYEEAVALMREKQEKFPKAIFRVLDKNQTTHTR